MLAKGTILQNRFKIIQQIEFESGNSNNYIAYDLDTYEIVAVKKITTERESLEQANLLNLFKDSDCVLKCIASFTENEENYIVTEYCRGGDLYEYLSRPLTPTLAKYIMKRLINIVYTLHLKHVFHGDIKPENFFIKKIDNGKPQIVIGDFGFARVLMDGEKIIPSNCTRYYASKQLRDGEPVGLSEDIYALGRVFQIIISRVGGVGMEPFEKINDLMLVENEEERIDILSLMVEFTRISDSQIRTS